MVVKNRNFFETLGNHLPNLKLHCTFFQISFTIRPENPGRIVILVTTMLALVNIFMSVRTSSPTSSANTVSSIAEWLICCLIFVISCLVEYGIILHLKYLTSEPYSEDEFLSISKKVDRISLYSTFLIFVVFTITFWMLQF